VFASLLLTLALVTKSNVERRAVAEKLRVSEERFRDFAQAASDWFWETDKDLRLSHLTGISTSEIFGKPERALLSKKRPDVLPLDKSNPEAKAHIEKFNAHKPFRNFRYLLKRPDGSRIWAEASGIPIYDSNGMFQGYRGTGRDVSAEVEARKAAENAQERFALAIENLSEGVVLWDQDDRFVMCNKAYRASTERYVTKLRPGMYIGDVLRCAAPSDPETAGGSEEWFEKRMKAHRNMTEPFEVLRDGRFYEVREEILPDNSLVLIVSDVTERKRTEERYQQAQKMESVGQLTGGIAHDFNNLIAVVIGNLEFALEQLSAENPAHSLLGKSLKAAERAATLTQRLLAFSRKQALDPKAIDANDLVMGLDDLLRRTLGEHIEIKVVTAAGLWLCDADPAQLENALLNLAVNARDAMPEGGKLTIGTANTQIDEIYAAEEEGLSSGQYVMVAVSDTGCGIPPDTLKHIFEPFFTTKDVGQGSGLGLSMVYGFAKQSGGHIAAYSEIGKGTTFKIYLPRAKSDKPTIEEGSDQLPESAEGYERILVVEDDTAVRDLVVNSAEGYGLLRHRGRQRAHGAAPRRYRHGLRSFADRCGAAGRYERPQSCRRGPGPLSRHQNPLHVRLHRGLHRSPWPLGRRHQFSSEAIPQKGSRCQSSTSLGVARESKVASPHPMHNPAIQTKDAHSLAQRERWP